MPPKLKVFTSPLGVQDLNEAGVLMLANANKKTVAPTFQRGGTGQPFLGIKPTSD